MSILHDIPVFRRGIHQLTLINTDLAEAESLVRRLAEEEKDRDPRGFAGLTSCVYFKMPYVQPWDPFHELRRLILCVRANTGLQADFRGIVAIEATEWIGHEKDAYFTVLLKFLYDHRDIWRASLVLHDATPAQLQRFASACAYYVTPRPFDIQIFSDQDRLCGLIHETFKNKGMSAEKSAVEMLARAVARPEVKAARSLAMIERTAEEVIAGCGCVREVTADAVGEYIRSPYSTLTMMAGKVLTNERSMNIETESLQL